MGRRRKDRSIDEWIEFGEIFVSAIKNKDIKKELERLIKELGEESSIDRVVILSNLNQFKSHDQSKDAWTKWIKRINTAKDDCKKIKMDCSIEAFEIIKGVKEKFKFKNTIKAMDYVIKSFPIGLRAELHNFSRKNQKFLNEAYKDEINSWEIENCQEADWVTDYCNQDVVPNESRFDELVLNMISDLSDKYTQMLGHNAQLQESLNIIERDNRALKCDLELAKGREALILKKMEEYIASTLSSSVAKEKIRLVSKKEYYDSSDKGKINRLKTIYADLGLEFPTLISSK
jgi:hypothetical protein